MSHTIEFVTTKDTEEMLRIYAPYVLETAVTFEYDVPSVEEFRTRVQETTKHFPWLVYKIDGKIAGYCYGSLFKSKEAFKWDSEVTIYLNKEFRGNGIGKKLYTTLIDLLEIQGYYNLYALITSSNEQSIRFHKYFNFESISFYENTGFKQGEWHSLSVLHKKLHDYDLEPKSPISIHEIDEKRKEDVLKKYI